MNPQVVDITGQKFGHLTATKHVGYRPGGAIWECLCDCGKTITAYSQNLRKGRTKSCGCSKGASIGSAISTHGETRNRQQTSEFRSWRAMRQRCQDPSLLSYKDYGGRGIKVCERWHRFENFLADMGRKPSPRHSIDRIDVNGNYEPGNCRWATPYEQRHNRRDTCASGLQK